MCIKKRINIIVIVLIVVALPSLCQMGCSWSPEEKAGTMVGSVVTTTAIGARTPAHEIEQVYYLGAFDPREQLPPTIYRVTVRGQASVLSSTKFATGWVPAQFIDSLNTHIGFDVNDPDSPNVKLTPSDGSNNSSVGFRGRKLVLFGPEGFREAPKDHRLVVVMGASPKAYFEAIDQTLGEFSRIQVEQTHGELKQRILRTILELNSQEDRINDLEVIVAEQFAKGGE